MTDKYSVSIHTLGCKLNQAESELLAHKFADAGYTITTGNTADIFILNTCSVTHIADRKSRRLIRMLRELNPGALIAVTGCYAEWAGEELKDLGADIVAGNQDKMLLPSALQDKTAGCFTGNKQQHHHKPLQRVRSFIKIQDGCGNNCSYCIVPLLRRQVYSIDPDLVIKEINSRVKDGYKEVILTGTEIGSYAGKGFNLQGLITRILYETGIERLHLSSLQPQEINQDLLDVWQDKRMCRHFHLALQSGSDRILRRMKRLYDADRYLSAVKTIRGRLPDASITSDIMVGFPGESEEDFRESYEFCRRNEFASMHVFAYSPRPGTAAAKMQGKVNEKVKKERSLRMLELAVSDADTFVRRFIGQIRPVLWENEIKPGSGIYVGLTDNYIRVYAESDEDITNTISEVRLVAPADAPGKALRASTRGNHGELWSIINENKNQGNATCITGRGNQTGR